MRNSYGSNIKYTIFGQSHSKAIGVIIDGLPAGFSFNWDLVDEQLSLRQGKEVFNTPRQEKIDYDIVSGYFNDKTTGDSLTIIFHNNDTKSKDYSHLINQPRPGHADFVAKMKYDNNHDYRGGGAFSGRMTTLIVLAGSLIKQILEANIPDFSIYTHIKSFQNLQDISYYDVRKEIVQDILNEYGVDETLIHTLTVQQQTDIAKKINIMLKYAFELDNLFISDELIPLYQEKAQSLRNKQDTAGGQLETIITGTPIKLGEPFFASVESVLSTLLYSIPSIKMVGFGNINDFKYSTGINCKDEYLYLDNQQAYTLYNHNGGINGGISNGEQIIITTTIKPIPSIAANQNTYSFTQEQISELNIKGRHDATVINRIIPVINAMVYLGIYDLYLEQQKYENRN